MEDKELAEVPREGKPIESLESQETDTPSESPAETKQIETAPSSEGAPSTPSEPEVPFHKHPRWQQREAELADLRKFKEEAEKRFQELPKTVLDTFKQEFTSKDVQVPDWFKELYGDNPKAYQLYKQEEDRREEDRRKAVLDSLEAKQKAEADDQAHWHKWVDDEIETLQSSGAQFDRNELMAVMQKYQPVENGSLSFTKGYEILLMQKGAALKDTQIARKKVADTTTPTPSGDDGGKDYLTSNDLRGKSWTSL